MCRSFCRTIPEISSAWTHSRSISEKIQQSLGSSTPIPSRRRRFQFRKTPRRCSCIEGWETRHLTDGAGSSNNRVRINSICEGRMTMSKLSDVFAAGIEEIRDSWVWFMVLGILLMILGAACIVKAQTATTFSILALGWVLAISGVLWFIGSFQALAWGGFFIYL